MQAVHRTRVQMESDPALLQRCARIQGCQPPQRHPRTHLTRGPRVKSPSYPGPRYILLHQYLVVSSSALRHVSTSFRILVIPMLSKTSPYPSPGASPIRHGVHKPPSRDAHGPCLRAVHVYVLSPAGAQPYDRHAFQAVLAAYTGPHPGVHARIVPFAALGPAVFAGRRHA